jgi:hypothetical protein
VAALDEVIALATKQNVVDVLGHAKSYRALALARLGRFDEARAEIDSALALAPHAGSPVKQADIHIGVGMTYYELGDIDKGIEHSRIGAEGAARVNGLQCACVGYYWLGEGEFEKRRLEAARNNFDHSLTLAIGPTMEMMANQIRGSVAVTEVEQGSAQAVAKLHEAISNAETLGDPFAVAAMSQRLAAILLRQGRTDEAATALQGAISFYRQRCMLPALAASLELMALIGERAGRADEAQQNRREASATKARLIDTNLAGRTPAAVGG